METIKKDRMDFPENRTKLMRKKTDLVAFYDCWSGNKVAPTYSTNLTGHNTSL